MQEPTADQGDLSGADSKKEIAGDETIYIRFTENGRRLLTVVQNLPLELSGANVLMEMKRKFGCNGAFVQDPTWGRVIHLQGDQRHKVGEYLQQADIVSRDVKMQFY